MKNKLWLGLIFGALVLIGATPAFFPSNQARGLLVDLNNVPYSIGTAGAAGSFFPSTSFRILLVDQNNQPYKATSGGSSGVTSITATSPLTGGVITTSGSIGCPTASGSVAGCLSSANWTTFNAKQAAGNYVTALTGDVTAAGPGSVAATLANTAVTPASYTNTNLTVDQKGRITAASNGSAPALTLIEKKIISGGAVTTVTFSNLDGNTDGVWLLIGRFQAASAANLQLRPNGATTNLDSQSWTSTGIVGTGVCRLIGGVGTNEFGSFSHTIHAQKNPGGQAFPLTYEGRAFILNTAVPIANSVAGIWNETATNVTSLDIVASASNAIGNGSEFALYKLAQ